MADKEVSIKQQIAAMEGWAIQVKQRADAGKYEEAKQLLRTINTQGRRLEWRGGAYGLKHLPELEEVKVLKKKISQARAAAQQAQSVIEHLGKVTKRENKSPAELAAIRKQESSYRGGIGKNVSILIQELKEAKAIADVEPWFNPAVLQRPENHEFLFMLLRGEGYYKTLRPIKFVLSVNWGIVDFRHKKIRNVDLSNADLSGVNLSHVYGEGADFSRTNLRGAILYRANLAGANFSKANLAGADLHEANLTGADLSGAGLFEADLHGAILYKANLTRTNLYGANLAGIYSLTKAQLQSANNWQEAKNIPRELL